MIRILIVLLAALAIGISTGLLVFWIRYGGIEEGFEPVNPNPETTDIRPSY